MGLIGRPRRKEMAMPSKPRPVKGGGGAKNQKARKTIRQYARASVASGTLAPQTKKYKKAVKKVGYQAASKIKSRTAQRVTAKRSPGTRIKPPITPPTGPRRGTSPGPAVKIRPVRLPRTK